MVESFMDVEVWKLGHKLSLEVFRLTKDLPKKEDYALTSQIRRSSTSVSANIAEGFGRKNSKDKIYFYTISRGSTFEIQSHLLYGVEIGYFNEKFGNRVIDEYDDLKRQLNMIMKSLR
ncbi:four helix bundle protein [Salibacter halophilus]|uniref:Four helix bundle protein n=1 Tax=Salibacter halophilus TaxID=1803916 RepID=A0A6N6M597_9FLAO|nr:four helix bundle protein [Salibacter halophilus]KAB1063524.1 four helix bundle protein [Salibacter halophilus]